MEQKLVERVANLLSLYGRSGNDFFKLWPDKQYFFTESGNGVVVYGVSHGVALVVGEPVAPPEEMEQSIRAFTDFSRQHRLAPIFHQVSANYLDIFRRNHFHSFKASEEAMVDLTGFSTRGHEGKQFRNTLRRMEHEGVRTELFEPPVPDAMVRQAQVVSDSWLASGRRERRFVVGRFEDEYVRNTPMLAAFDVDGQMQGFVNLIPSYAPETATIDLMRHRMDGPPGVMDLLFLKLFDYDRAQGFRYVSLGPAPIIELPAGESASREEQAFYALTRYLNAVFSMKGLRDYKAKFATEWHPLYLIHHRVTDWPRVLRVFTELTELPENQQPWLSREHRQQFQHIMREVIADVRRSRKEKRQAKKEQADG